MRKLFLFVFMILTSGSLNSQQEMHDWRVEFGRLMINDMISRQYDRFKEVVADQRFRDALKIAEAGYRLADSVENHIFQEKFAYALGYIHQQLKEPETAVDYYVLAESLSIEYGFQDRLVYIYGQLGKVYLDQFDYNGSTNAYLKSLSYAHKVNNHRYEIFAFNELGLIELRLKNYQQALDQFSRSLDLREKYKITDNIGVIKYNMALCYKYMSEYEKAKPILHEILKDNEEGRCPECNEEFLSNIYDALKEMN